MACGRSDSRRANDGGSRIIRSNDRGAGTVELSQSKASAFTLSWLHRPITGSCRFKAKFRFAAANATGLISRSVTETAPPRAAYREKPPEKLKAFNTRRPLE